MESNWGGAEAPRNLAGTTAVEEEGAGQPPRNLAGATAVEGGPAPVGAPGGWGPLGVGAYASRSSASGEPHTALAFT